MKKRVESFGEFSNCYAKYIAVLYLFFLLFSSCRTQRQVPYLEGRIDSAGLNQYTIPQPIIQKGDILSIVVFSDDPAASLAYNETSSPSPMAGQNLSGILVDADGNIVFQGLGPIKVEGLTTTQLSLYLREQLKKFLNNPYTSIKILNYRVSILGEVLHPGGYTTSNEGMSILELLGMAGDVTMYGIKERVVVIRQTNGKREIGYIDLTRTDVFNSPYFNLLQNDVVIVNADPKKPNVSDQAISRRLTWVTATAAVVTSISVVINLLR